MSAACIPPPVEPSESIDRRTFVPLAQLPVGYTAGHELTRPR